MLPQPEIKSNISLEEALKSRRSVRNFSSFLLNLTDVTPINHIPLYIIPIGYPKE